MDAFLELFKALGYKHVVAIFDGDKKGEAQQATTKFPEYKIVTLITDDIRDKTEKQIYIETISGKRTVEEVLVKKGLAGKDKKLKSEYKDYVAGLIQEINKYLTNG